MLSNKSCVLNMAQMLVNFNDLKVSGRAYAALGEANETDNRSCYNLKGFHKKLDFLHIGPEAGRTLSVAKAGLPRDGSDTMPPL